MAENRSALIVAVSEYQDAGLRQLVAPAQDAVALARVLGDPAIGGFAVKTLLNQSAYQVNREIEAFFANRAKENLLLFYFCGHGVKDEEGRLYFATPNTSRKLLRTTAVAATLLNDVMHLSRSRRQVLILDCCYSGAFARGMTHRADEAVGAGEYFREGRGQFVLTASDALQYAFEGEEIKGKGVRSVFTHTLVQGLETGEADLDGDGMISCDELYDYLYERITDRMPQQKPRKWAFAVEGEIIIARNPHPVVKLAASPAELQQSIEDPRPWVREGAARQLGDLLQHSNKRLAAAALNALRQMAEDDSQKVRTMVAEILKAHADEKPLVSESQELATALPKKTEAPPTPPAILRVKPATALPKKTEAPPTPPAILRKLLVVLVVVILGGGLYHVGKGWFEKTPVPPSPVPEIRSSTPPGIEESASTVTMPARQESTAKSPSLPPTPPGIEESVSTVTTPARQESTAKSPSLLPIQTIHGWSAQQVRSLQQQTAQALKISVEFQDNIKDGGQGPMMVVIPGGRFQMGSPATEPEWSNDEGQHEVEVTAFAIGKYEVTFEEYDRFAEATGRGKPADQGWGRGRRPAINVNWLDAMAYAEWLSEQTEQTYRLPTEAEWEYAARAGTTTPFHFGATITTRQANFEEGEPEAGGPPVVAPSGWSPPTKGTIKVGRFPANAWGLHDMHGNVWEWTCSPENYYENHGGAELRCISASKSSGPRVLRGGSWLNRPKGLRSATRTGLDPRYGSIDVGFRLARTLTL